MGLCNIMLIYLSNILLAIRIQYLTKHGHINNQNWSSPEIWTFQVNLSAEWCARCNSIMLLLRYYYEVMEYINETPPQYILAISFLISGLKLWWNRITSKMNLVLFLFQYEKFITWTLFFCWWDIYFWHATYRRKTLVMGWKLISWIFLLMPTIIHNKYH